MCLAQGSNTEIVPALTKLPFSIPQSLSIYLTRLSFMLNNTRIHFYIHSLGIRPKTLCHSI